MKQFILEQLHQLPGFIAGVSVLVIASLAVIKFRLFDVIARRWQSEVTCTQWKMNDGSAQVKVQYTIHTTGSPRLPVALALQRDLAIKLAVRAVTFHTRAFQCFS